VTRYFPVTPRPEEGETPPDFQAVPGTLKLSREALEIRETIRRPMSDRTPAGFQANFLDSYQPNVTSHLSPELRRQLFDMGQAGKPELPAGTYVRQCCA